MNLERKIDMSLKKIAGTKWLKLFSRTYKDKNDNDRVWDFCSRKDNPDEVTDRADAVCVVPFLEDGRMVIIKQGRGTLNQYFIESVAGLHDQPTVLKTAIKELKEETGLECYEPIVFEDKLYNSIGITDESCSYVFCKAKGEPSTEFCEASEDIEVIIVDRKQARQLMREETFSAKIWLILLAYSNGFDWLSVE